MAPKLNMGTMGIEMRGSVQNSIETPARVTVSGRRAKLARLQIFVPKRTVALRVLRLWPEPNIPTLSKRNVRVVWSKSQKD